MKRLIKKYSLMLPMIVMIFSSCSDDEMETRVYSISTFNLCTGGENSGNLNLVFYSSQEDANKRQNQILSITGTKDEVIDLSSLVVGQEYWVWAQNNNGLTNWGDILVGSNFTPTSGSGTGTIHGRLTNSEKKFVGTYEVTGAEINGNSLDLQDPTWSYLNDDILEITTAEIMNISKGTDVSGDEDVDKSYTFPYSSECLSSGSTFSDQGLNPSASTFFNENDAQSLTWENSRFILEYSDGTNSSKIIYTKIP